MARSTPGQYPVHLSPEQRQRLHDICRNGHAPAKKIRHAQVLLLSDHDRKGGAQTRTQVGETLKTHPNTVDKIRKRFVLDGEAPALNRKPRETPPTPSILDGHAEAHLVALCCSDPPQGRTVWTMQLLANALMSRRIVTRISAETVRRALKKRTAALAKGLLVHPRTGQGPVRVADGGRTGRLRGNLRRR
jgi:hypothetical protein